MENSARIVGAAVAITTTVTVGIVVALIIARSRLANPAARGLLTAGVIVAVVISPGLVDFLVLRLNQTSGVDRAYIDQGFVAGFLPAATAILIGVAAWVRTRAGSAA